MSRLVIPPMFSMAACVTNWATRLREQRDQLANNPAALKLLPNLPDANSDSLQLRWMTNSKLGLPRNGFTVWHRSIGTLALTDLPGPLGGISGYSVARFGELQAIVQFDFTNSGNTPYMLVGYAPGGQAVAFTSGVSTGAMSLEIAASGIDSAILFGTGTITKISGVSSRQFANDPSWKLIERVGLPYDASQFAGSGYDAHLQGLTATPLDPVSAALRRLNAGPPMGWLPGIGMGLAPPWRAPDGHALIQALQQTLFSRIRKMLAASAGPGEDAAVKLNETLQPPKQPGGAPEIKTTSTTDLPPLLLLLLNASSDPFNALALGYGTSYASADLPPATQPPGMIASVPPASRLGSFLVECATTIDGHAVTLADFVIAPWTVDRPAAPAPVIDFGSQINRPTNKSLPASAAIGVAWPRPAQLASPMPRIASYGLARSDTGAIYADLIEQRPGGGPSAYVATTNPHAPADFVGYVDGAAPRPGNSPAQYVYAVAAQDLFGQWSNWSTVAAQFPEEPFILPQLGAGTFTASPNASGLSSGSLTVEVSWDWTDREPAEIDLHVALFRPAGPSDPLPALTPSGLQLALGAAAQPPLRLTFAGGSLPSSSLPGVSVSAVPRSPAPTSLADVRTYKVEIPGFMIDFGGVQQVFALVLATGAQRITPSVIKACPRRGAFAAQNPNPPQPPSLGGPQFSSLPDHIGVARAHLTWSGGGPRWAVYEATETAVLNQAGLPAPDVKAAWTTRLAAINALNPTTFKNAFRRITATPLTVPELEVELPRGTAIMHLYAVRSVGDNNLESPFPPATTSLAAVAVPRLRVPPEPALRADLVGPPGAQQVRIRITSRRGIRPGRFELFRTSREALSRDINLMGPALARSDGPGFTSSTNADGTVTAEYHDSSLVPSWDTVTYRAVAWGLDDPVGGFRGGRSPSSTNATIVLPPPVASPLGPLMLQSHMPLGSLLSFQVGAPAAATELGSHILSVQVRDPAQHFANTFRLDIPLENLPVFKSYGEGVANSGPGRIFRYLVPGGGFSIAAYVPRPTRATASTVPYRVLATLTDPLRRVSAKSVEVKWA
jgi:hypothetical protein